MHAHELQALRRHLHLSADEAARWVARDSERPQGVEPRTWNRWESGRVPVPRNIAARVLELVAVCRTVCHKLQQAARLHHQAEGHALAVLWYLEADDCPGGGLAWRVDQAAKAAALAELGAQVLQLVPFDARTYLAWRCGGQDGSAQAPRRDTDDARSAWAAHQAARMLAAPETATKSSTFAADAQKSSISAPLAPIGASTPTPSTNWRVDSPAAAPSAPPVAPIKETAAAAPAGSQAAFGITIPAGITFADLRLSRDPVTLEVEFDWTPIEAICAASGIPMRILTHHTEDNVGALIVTWYNHHRAAGGAPDPVAEQLIAEVQAEEAAGGQAGVISHGGGMQ